MSGRRDRLVIFGDWRVGVSGKLLMAFLAELRTRPDIELVALCDTAPSPAPGRFRGALSGPLRAAAVFAFNGQRRPFPPAFDVVARRHGMRVIVPPDRNVNHPSFVAMLRERYRPTLAVCTCSLQIFGAELLASFEVAVNFHDGSVPFYKGLSATAWSLYYREPATGYAWHRMDAGIDTGPVLHRDQVAVTPGEPAWVVRERKLTRAAADAGHVLDLMVQRAPGVPQHEPGSYFSRRERLRLCRLNNPTTLPAAEILHRLRSFEILELELDGALYQVTALRECRRASRLSFATSDGRIFAPHRCMFLPVWLYRLYRRLKAHPDARRLS